MGQVIQSQNTSPNRKRMGDILFLLKDYDEAIAEYLIAFSIDRHFFPALNEIGWVLITQYQQSLGLDEAKREAALDAWHRSLAINPEQPKINRLIQAYSQRYSDGK